MALSPAVAPSRSVMETLRLVQTAVWAVLFVAVAAILSLVVVGALLAAPRDPTPFALFVLTALFGTVVLAVADVILG